MDRTRVLLALIGLTITAIFARPLWSSLAQQPSVGEKRPDFSAEREGKITGRVVVDDGLPAGEVIVQASALGADSFDLASNITSCDDKGYFELTGLKQGVYRLSASLPGYVGLDIASEREVHRTGESVTIRMVKGGVITGRITDASGDPLEGIYVNLRMVRDHQGRDAISNPSTQGPAELSRQTDDRGIYRIYGIIPGTYLISVVDTLVPHHSLGNFRHDSPSYYLSPNHSSAAEVTVRGGKEITEINIQHRGERGHSISGTISGKIGAWADFNLVNIRLRNETGIEIGSAVSLAGSRRFDLYGVPDGVYELLALYLNERSDFSISMPRRITIKGADLRDIDLKLLEAGSVSGRVIIESSKVVGDCGRQERASADEVFLQVKKIDHRGRDQGLYLTAVNEKGEFVQKLLENGRYRIIPDLPADHWYPKAITIKTKEAPHQTLDLARDGIAVMLGESLTGIEVRVAENAAILRGHLSAASKAQTKAGTSSRWKVHLVPAEEAAAEDVLRYAETFAQNDGSFELKHLAPGKYFMLAREVSEKDMEIQSHPVAWDSLERIKLRRHAQSLRQEIELLPCQQATLGLR